MRIETPLFWAIVNSCRDCAYQNADDCIPSPISLGCWNYHPKVAADNQGTKNEENEMENENRIEDLEKELKRNKITIIFGTIICVVMIVSIIITGLYFGIREFVSSIRQARVDEAIINAAVNEMEISPEHVELHLLYKEWVPWLDCYSYTYAMVADGEIFIVDVNGIEDEVRYVDVIWRACS